MKNIHSLQTRPWRAFLKSLAAVVCLAFTLTSVAWGETPVSHPAGRAKLAPSSRVSDERMRWEVIDALDLALDREIKGMKLPEISLDGSDGAALEEPPDVVATRSLHGGGAPFRILRNHGRVGYDGLNARILYAEWLLKRIGRELHLASLRGTSLNGTSVSMGLGEIAKIRLAFSGLPQRARKLPYVANLMRRLKVAAFRLELYKHGKQTLGIPSVTRPFLESDPDDLELNA